MPLSQFVAIFLLEEVAFLLYIYNFGSKKFTVLFWILKKCDQVQKLVPAMVLPGLNSFAFFRWRENNSNSSVAIPS